MWRVGLAKLCLLDLQGCLGVRAGTAIFFGLSCGNGAMFWAQEWCQFSRPKMPRIRVPPEIWLLDWICNGGI